MADSPQPEISPFEDALRELNIQEKTLKQIVYVHQGTSGADFTDWEDLEDKEKLAWIYVSQSRSRRFFWVHKYNSHVSMTIFC